MLDNSLVNSDSVYRLQHRDQRGSTKLLSQVVTKRCLLSWLTNNALDMSPNTGVGGGGRSYGVSNKLWRSNYIFNLCLQQKANSRQCYRFPYP
jgi:hypothetical protein